MNEVYQLFIQPADGESKYLCFGSLDNEGPICLSSHLRVQSARMQHTL